MADSGPIPRETRTPTGGPVWVEIHAGSCCIRIEVSGAQSVSDGARQPVAGAIRPAPLTLAEALDAWARYMGAKGKRKGSIYRYQQHLKDAANVCGWAALTDLSVVSLEDFLAEKRTGRPADPTDPEDRGRRPWASSTHDTACSAFRSFGTFLVRTDRLPVNPFERLESIRDEGDEGARALTPDEARRLLTAAATRMVQSGRARKGNAALFYAALFLSGLRYMEMAQLRWKCLDLDAAPPTYTTDRAYDKSRKSWTNPLAPELVGLLRNHRPSGAAPESLVFPRIPTRPTFQMDRDGAGLVYKTREGAATPHAARKSFATWIDATGASVGVRSTLLRHRSGMADKHYVRPEMGALVSAVSGLPTIWPGIVKIAIDSGASGRLDGVVTEQGFMRNSPTSECDRGGRPAGMSPSVTVCVPQAGRTLPSHSHTEPVPGRDSERTIEHGNGQSRPSNRALYPDLTGSQLGNVRIDGPAEELARFLRALTRGARDERD